MFDYNWNHVKWNYYKQEEASITLVLQSWIRILESTLYTQLINQSQSWEPTKPEFGKASILL
jgi:hypothetical protein